MPPETDMTFTISVLIPVMFVIIAEVSGIAREIPLLDYYKKPVPLTLRERRVNKILTVLPGLDHVPQFGYFSLLHAVNVVILFFGAGVVNYALTGPAQFILGFSVLIVWQILPFIEIQEYREISHQGPTPSSIKSHFFWTFVAFLFISGGGRALAHSLPAIAVVIAILGFIMYTIGQTYFALHLERELDGVISEAS